MSRGNRKWVQIGGLSGGMTPVRHYVPLGNPTATACGIKLPTSGYGVFWPIDGRVVPRCADCERARRRVNSS